MTTGKPEQIAGHYTICGCDDVVDELARRAAKDLPYAAVISIEHPGVMEGRGRAPRLPELGIGTPQHLFSFWDNFVDGSPDLCGREDAIAMLRILRDNRGTPVLIHCRQGKSRSAAIALMGIADELGRGREAEAVNMLDDLRNIATPNPLIVNLADTILERGGALTGAVRTHHAIGPRMHGYVAAVKHAMARHVAADPERAAGRGVVPERLESSLHRLLGGALRL